MSSNACAGSFIVKNGRVSRPPPAFIPGIREDIALEVPDQDRVPTFLPARNPNPNRGYPTVELSTMGYKLLYPIVDKKYPTLSY